MNRYGLHGKLTASDGHGDALASILQEASDLVRSRYGSLAYIVSRDPGDAHAIWVTEVWNSKEDHDTALASDDVRALITKALPLLNGMPEKGQELSVISGF